MIKIGNTYILHDGEEMHKTMKMDEINKATNIITIAKTENGEEFIELNKIKYRHLSVAFGDKLTLKTFIPKNT